MRNNEFWKDIEGYEGLYQVSNYGRVKSLNYNRTKKEQILKPRYVKGYIQVLLSKNGESKQYYVHDLVALTFLNKYDFKSMQNEDRTQIKLEELEINHKSEIKDDNRVDNLEWCTRLYNVNYGSSKEKLSKINKNKKLDEEHKTKIKNSHLKRRKFNKELNDYLITNANKYTIKELVPIINVKFNECFTKENLQKYLYRNKIKFKYESKRKSHPMGEKYPIGYEYKKSDGMTLIKISKNRYEYKQRLIYSQYYNIDLTEDDYIIFLDQDRTNFDISNLKRISRHESSILANQKIFSTNPEATETGILVAKLMIKSKERKQNK